MLVSAVAAVASPGFQSSLMTEVVSTTKDPRAGKLDANVSRSRIMNLLALKDREECVFNCSSKESAK